MKNTKTKTILSYVLCFVMVFGTSIWTNPVEAHAAVDQYPIIIVPGIMGTELAVQHPHVYIEDSTTTVEILSNHSFWLPELRSIFRDGLSSLYMDIDGYPTTIPVFDPRVSWPEERVTIPEDSIKTNYEVKQENNSLYYIESGQIFDDNPALYIKNPLNSFYGKLKERLEEEFDNVYYFGYDWRRGNAYSAEKLERFINKITAKHNTDKVNIVAHSMGGLVSTYYINNAFTGPHKVNKLITMGTPYLGAPKSLYIFETGEALFEPVNTVVKDTVKEAAPNINSIYQLLPNRKYFEYNGPSNVDENYIYESRFVYDPDTHNFDYDAVAVDGYDNSMDYILSRKWANAPLINKADKFHDMNDVLKALAAVDSYVMIGDSYGTNGRITYNYDAYGNETGVYDYDYNGDGTVPLVSANIGNRAQEVARVYFTDAEHGALARKEQCANQAVNILKGNPATVDGMRDYHITKPSLEYLIKCPVKVDIYDSEGNHNGYTYENGEASMGEVNIPGSIYDLHVPDGPDNPVHAGSMDVGVYNFVITGTGEGTMECTFKLRDDNFKCLQSVVFRDVPVSEGMVITTETDFDKGMVLNVDSDNDGVTDSVLPPSYILEGEELDLTPWIRANIEPEKKSNNWYNTDVTLSYELLRPVDNPRYSLNSAAEEEITSDTLLHFGEEGMNTVELKSEFKVNVVTATGIYASTTPAAITNSYTNSTYINIDKTAPQFTTNIKDNAVYGLNQLSTFNVKAYDELSGVDRIESTVESGGFLDTTTEGLKTISVKVWDKAGNMTEKAISYTVREGAYNTDNEEILVEPPLYNIYQDYNIFNLNSTIPVKFRLDNAPKNTPVTAKLYVGQPEGDYVYKFIEATAPGNSAEGNNFNKNKNKFHFNLDTKPLNEGRWMMKIELSDGTVKYIRFTLAEGEIQNDELSIMYICTQCGTVAKSKENANLICGDCDMKMVEMK